MLPATEPRPETPTAWVEEGRRLERQERNTSALAAYDRALALDPAFEPAWMRKALLLEELDRVEEALAAYAALLERHPSHLAACSNRAGLFLQEGRLDEALASLELALAADPGNHLLALNKGLLLLQGFNRAAEALPWLQRAQAAGLPEAEEAAALCLQCLDRPSQPLC